MKEHIRKLFVLSGPAVNTLRRLKKRKMAELGFKSGKSYKRYLKKNRPVRAQYYKDGALVPTKRVRRENATA